MKKFVAFLMMLSVLVMSFGAMPASASAAALEVPYANLSTDANKYMIQPRSDGYTYWQVDSKEIDKAQVYGDWKYGPSGEGPGTIELDTQETVSNSISGTFTSTGDISASLGFSVTESRSVTVRYSLPVDYGHVWIIKYRPTYVRYKVVQNEYQRIDGITTKTGRTKISFVEQYQNWDFGYDVVR